MEKKRVVVMGVVVMVLIVIMTASCGQKAGEAEKELTGTLSEIAAQLNDAVGMEIVLVEEPVTKENAAYYLGTEEIEFAEALSSEPMISANPHSVVLVRMNEGADIEAAKTKIRENADPAKWICVRVDPDDVIVESIGSIIMLVMSERASDYEQAFRALAE